MFGWLVVKLKFVTLEKEPQKKEILGNFILREALGALKELIEEGQTSHLN
jgi:hypothetical protein